MSQNIQIVIFERKFGPEQEKVGVADKIVACCAADLIQQTPTLAEFQSREYLLPHLRNAYYVERRSGEGKRELWLISLSKNRQLEAPYTYIATFVEKYRDVPIDWYGDK
jgi:hypothetical protein